MNIKTIDCIGSDYPMGVLQGRLLKDSVGSAWDYLQNNAQIDYCKPKLMPKQLYLVHCQKKADTFLKNYLAKFYPELAERVLGIAQGATLSEETLYFMQAYEMELMSKPDTFKMGAGLQIGIAANNSLDKRPIIAMSWDYAWAFEPYFVVRNSKPRTFFHSTELTLSFMAGCLAGVNEHGVAVVLTPTMAIDSITLTSVPLPLMLQRVLETCKTASEAVQTITKQNRDAGYNVLVADSTKVFALELSRSAYTCHEVTDFVVKGSYYTTTEMQSKQPPLEAAFGAKAMENYSGKPIMTAEQHRVKSATQMLAAAKADIDTVKDILSSHGDQQVGNDLSLCRHGTELRTMASVIITPATKTIYAGIGKPCEAYYRSFAVTAQP